MRREREFDCIRLKDEIQARVARRFRGLSEAQVRSRTRRQLATSKSPIGRLWRSLETSDVPATR